jgi:hypothetical protein
MHEGTVRKYFRTTFESTTYNVVLSSTKVKKDIFVRTKVLSKVQRSTRYYFQYVYFRTFVQLQYTYLYFQKYSTFVLSTKVRKYFRTVVLYYISTYSTRLPSKVLSYNARYIQYVVSSNVSHIKVVYGSTCSRRA